MSSKPGVWVSTLVIVALLVAAVCAHSAQVSEISVQLTPDQGLLSDLLRRETAKARKLGRTPFVELTSSACAGCNAINNSLSEPQMLDAFAGVHLIQLDVVVWRNHLRPRGFDPRSVPKIYLVDDDGNPVGPVIADDAWGDDVPAQMAPPLKDFFQKNLRKKK